MKNNDVAIFVERQYGVYWDDEGFYWTASNIAHAEEIQLKNKPGGLIVVREITKTYGEWKPV